MPNQNQTNNNSICFLNALGSMGGKVLEVVSERVYSEWKFNDDHKSYEAHYYLIDELPQDIATPVLNIDFKFALFAGKSLSQQDKINEDILLDGLPIQDAIIKCVDFTPVDGNLMIHQVGGYNALDLKQMLINQFIFSLRQEGITYSTSEVEKLLRTQIDESDLSYEVGYFKFDGFRFDGTDLGLATETPQSDIKAQKRESYVLTGLTLLEAIELCSGGKWRNDFEINRVAGFSSVELQVMMGRNI